MEIDGVPRRLPFIPIGHQNAVRHQLSEHTMKLKISDYVKLDRAVGEVKYIGAVRGYEGEWVGVDWFNGARGKHDGTVKGVKYFDTRSPKCGSFVRANKLDSGRDLLSEVLEKYVADENHDGLADHRIGAKHVEAYLENAVSKQKMFQLLYAVVLDYGRVSHAHTDKSVIFSRCRELNLYGNMLSRWSTLLDILEAFPVVRSLNLGMNYFIHDPEFGVESRVVHSPVQFLILNKCQLTESMIAIFLRAFPNLLELHLHDAGLTGFTVAVTALTNVTTVSLENNPLESFSNAASLKMMANLTTLNVAGCAISAVDFGEVVGFSKLHTLSLVSNPIQEWSSISELSRLPVLRTLNINHLPHDRSRDIIIAKLPKLKTLNHSDITSVERRSAEIIFLNTFGRAPIPEEHLDDINRLKEFYGDPDRPAFDPRDMRLVLLKLQYKEKKIDRSFPRNTSIQKFIGISSRLLRFPPKNIKMEAVDPDGCRNSIDFQLDRDLSFYGVGDGFHCVFS